jgi:hypothetical protein
MRGESIFQEDAGYLLSDASGFSCDYVVSHI